MLSVTTAPATEDDIYIASEVAVAHQRAGLTIVLQTVINATVGNEEGILTTQNADVIQPGFTPYRYAVLPSVRSSINAVAQIVFDGQVWQLQTAICDHTTVMNTC